MVQEISLQNRAMRTLLSNAVNFLIAVFHDHIHKYFIFFSLILLLQKIKIKPEKHYVKCKIINTNFEIQKTKPQTFFFYFFSVTHSL